MCFVAIYEILILTNLQYVLASLNRDYHEEKLAGERWNRDTYNLRYDFCYARVCLPCCKRLSYSSSFFSIQIRLTGLKEIKPIYQSPSYFDDSIEIYEAQFSANGCTNIPPSRLSELYCLYCSSWKETKVCKCVVYSYCLDDS